MAKLLNANPDPLLALAGRIPDELAEIIHRHPTELPRLIRLLADWESEEIARLVEELEEIKRQEVIETRGRKSEAMPDDLEG
jgi:hypothetical protein